MLQFEKPIYKITDSIESNFYGRFELEPLERGFGTTLGNALRRVMLSSLPGSAISCVKIDGVLHEFQTIEGVYEDVTTIILNLKGVVFKNHSNESKVVRINTTKEGEINVSELANIASCPEFKELISLSYPALGFTYDELLEELEDNPISFEKFKNNINKIVNSFYQYGKNIYLWQ